MVEGAAYDRVLLLSSPLTLPDFEFVGRAPNLGIASLAGNINHLCTVKLADLHVLRPSRVEPFLRRAMRRLQPDLVGLSAMTFQYSDAVRRARWLKREYGVDVVMGGYHPSLMHREVAASPDAAHFDYIVRGEGEGAMARLVGGEPRGKIRGLSYRGAGGRFHHNPPAPLLDLSELRPPDRGARLLPRGFYSFGRRADGVETSRGCVQGCKFCSIAQMYGKSFRTFPIPFIIDQLRELRARGVRSVGFTDDNVTLDLKRLQRLCDAIIEAGLDDLHYLTQASCSGVARDPALVGKMARAGFKLVFLGIENTLKRNLDLYDKTRMAANTEQAVRSLHAHGIIIACGLILGNPEDTRLDIWANFELARQYRVDSPIFYLLTPYPKTVLREELLTQGLVTNPDDFAKYTGLHANVRTKHLSADELQREVWQMVARFYNRDWMRYTVIKRVYPLWFARKSFAVLPNMLRRKLGVRLGLTSEDELFRLDLQRGVLYRHVEV